MPQLYITVGTVTSEDSARHLRALTAYDGTAPRMLTVLDGAYLRRALCVDAKDCSLTVLTGDATLCRNTVQALIGNGMLRPLACPPAEEGWAYEYYGRVWAWLPATPTSFDALWYECLLPLVGTQDGTPAHYTVNIFGLAPATIRKRLSSLPMDFGDNTLYPVGEEWRLRLSAATESEVLTSLSAVQEVLGSYAYGVNQPDLRTRALTLLQEKGLTAAVVGEVVLPNTDCPVKAVQPTVVPEEESASSLHSLALAARATGESALGLALLPDDTTARPTIRLALTDGKRIWRKTLCNENVARLQQQAQTALWDLTRRYTEALPAVIAGGEPLAPADVHQPPAIPVSPLKNEQPLLLRPSESKSERIFKVSLIVLLILFVLFAGAFVWNQYFRESDEQSAFRELGELYNTEVSGADASQYPEGMLSRFYALYNENTDIYGWLQLGSNNSYPIMNGLGKTDYSRQGFHKQISELGIPYFFPALPHRAGNHCLIISGNHAKDGEMFGVLTNYLNARYVRENPRIEMNTIYRTGTWQVFAVMVMEENDTSFNFSRTAFANTEDRATFVEELCRRSRFAISTQVGEETPLLLLTTPLTSEEGEGDQLVVAFCEVADTFHEEVEVTSSTSVSTGTTPAEISQEESASTDESREEVSKPKPEESKPSVDVSEEESSESEDGGTEFIEPEEPEEPTPTVTVKPATTAQTLATTKATVTTTSPTTPPLPLSTTTPAGETTVNGAVTTPTVSTASSTASVSPTTSKQNGSASLLREGTIAESEYWPYFRIKDAKTGKTLVPTTRKELQLGLFYLVKREMGSASLMPKSTEAQKAQAVASYTYVLYYCGNQKNTAYYSFNFPSYNPNNATDKKLYQAVGEVLGVKMIYPEKTLKKQAINAMYSASSCGVTSSCHKVYTQKLPFLMSVKSPYDTDTYIRKYSNNKQQSTATFTITYKELLASLADNLGISAAEIQAETKGTMPVYATEWDGGEGGYVYRTNLYYYFNSKKTYITGKQIRGAVSGMRSHSFEVTAYDKATDTMTVVTKGHGHGLGLSQYGAAGYANEAGWSYDRILAHYYSITDTTDYQLVAPKW